MPTPNPTLPPPKGSPSDKQRPLLRGLERAASEMNPFLTILAIGIAILNLTLYVGMVGAQTLIPHIAAHAATTATPAPMQQSVADWR